MIKELTLGHFIETKSMMELDQQKISNWITTHDPKSKIIIISGATATGKHPLQSR